MIIKFNMHQEKKIITHQLIEWIHWPPHSVQIYGNNNLINWNLLMFNPCQSMSVHASPSQLEWYFHFQSLSLSFYIVIVVVVIVALSIANFYGGSFFKVKMPVLPVSFFFVFAQCSISPTDLSIYWYRLIIIID